MNKFLQTPLFFVLLAIVFFMPFLGGVHLFDWDEINFAEIAREMVVLNNYLETYINYEVFTEKPPLFMWLQAVAMQLFGIGDYAARFPNAFFGMIVLPVLFIIGKRVKNERFGFYWALAWFGSILPHLYFKSGIIDPVFNFFIFMGLYFLIEYSWARKNTRAGQHNVIKYCILAGVFTGLAVLTKGPVAFLITGLVLAVYFIKNRFKLFISIPHVLLYILVMLSVFGIWAGLNYMQHGTKFMVEFTLRQWAMLTTPDAGHGGFLGYHFVVILVGCFPASIFAIQGMIKRSANQSSSERDFKSWMVILFWVVLILFTLVTTKIVHYSSMAYYPLTFLAALSLYHLERKEWRFTMLMKIGLWFIGSIAVLLTVGLPYFGMNIKKFKSLFANDPFAAENITAVVNWTGWESLVGVFLFIIILFSLVLLRNRMRQRFVILFFGSGVWVMLTLVFYIAKVESISQRAAIEFWEDKQSQECYVTTYGYKSYAHLYYARIVPPHNVGNNALSIKKNSNTRWLLHGEIDKPVYISCKINHREKLEEELKDEQFLYAKNGFYFYKRVPK